MNLPAPALVTFGDSSGNPARTVKGYEDAAHFIIVTITADVREAHRVDAQVQRLKERHFGHQKIERVSLHGHRLFAQLHHRTGNKARAEQILAQIFDEIVEIVLGMEATINVTIIDKRFPDESAPTNDTVFVSWAHASNMILQNLQTAPPETVAMILLDRYDDATNRIVSKAMAPLLRQFAGTDRLVGGLAMPRPIFVDSRSCNMVQLADMILTVVAKRAEGKDSVSFAKWYKLLEPKIPYIARFSM